MVRTAEENLSLSLLCCRLSFAVPHISFFLKSDRPADCHLATFYIACTFSLLIAPNALHSTRKQSCEEHECFTVVLLTTLFRE